MLVAQSVPYQIKKKPVYKITAWPYCLLYLANMSTLKERRTWVKPVLNAKVLHNTQDYHQTCHLSGAAGQHKFLYRLLSLNNFGVSLHLEPCNFVTSKRVPITSQCPELNLNALGVCKYRKLLVHHFECFRAKTATVARKAAWTVIYDSFLGYNCWCRSCVRSSVRGVDDNRN